MKRIIGILVVLIFSTYSCKKDGDIFWILREHVYEITNMPATNQNGDIVDLRKTVFGFADRMTFKISGLFAGRGVITIFSTHYTDQDMIAYGWVEDYETGCWYYDYYEYRITIKQAAENTYDFQWSMSGTANINLDFADYADLVQGTNFQGMWNLLGRKYHVFADSFLENNPATAKVIALQGSNGIDIVLLY